MQHPRITMNFYCPRSGANHAIRHSSDFKGREYIEPEKHFGILDFPKSVLFGASVEVDFFFK